MSSNFKSDGLDPRPKASVILILFILTLISILAFHARPPISPVNQGEVSDFPDPYEGDFFIINNTRLEFFMYRISGNIWENPTAYTLPPKGGRTSISMATNKFNKSVIDAFFWAYDPRFGIDPERAGQIEVRMFFVPAADRHPARYGFERINVTRASISYETNVFYLTFY